MASLSVHASLSSWNSAYPFSSVREDNISWEFSKQREEKYTHDTSVLEDYNQRMWCIITYF